MATYKWYHDKRNKTASSWPLKIAISHRQLTDYILTGYSLNEAQWNKDSEKVENYPNSKRVNADLSRKYSIASDIVESTRPYWKKLNAYQIKEMIENKIEEVTEEKLASQLSPLPKNFSTLSSKDCQTCYYEYAEKKEAEFRQVKRSGTADTFAGSVKYFLKVYSSYPDSLPFSKITKPFLSDLERKYLAKGNKINGIGVHLRAIRQIFNMAIEDDSTDVTEAIYPFGKGKGKFKIRSQKAEKKNIPANEMQKLLDYPLTPETPNWYHQQYYKFYFDAWGANFCDIAFARVKQVKDGRFHYRRRKTQWSENAKPFNIKLSETGVQIAEYFSKGKKPDDLLFPILEDVINCGDWDVIWKAYKQRMTNHGRRIKSIGQQAGVEVGKIYMFRHTFFQTALVNGTQKSEIQQMAGHGSAATTETYLEGFSNSHLDEQADHVRSTVYLQKSSKATEGSKQEPSLKSSLLSDTIHILANQQQMMTVEDYLLSILPRYIAQGKVKHIDLVTDLLQNTGCKDGKLAKQYTNAFLSY